MIKFGMPSVFLVFMSLPFPNSLHDFFRVATRNIQLLGVNIEEALLGHAMSCLATLRSSLLFYVFLSTYASSLMRLCRRRHWRRMDAADCCPTNSVQVCTIHSSIMHVGLRTNVSASSRCEEPVLVVASSWPLVVAP